MTTDIFKKIIICSLVFVLISLGLSACAQAQVKTPKEVSISWSEIEQGVGIEIGDTLEVKLPANPSTGYTWEVGFYNQSVLKPYGEPEFLNTSSNLGAEETQLMHFEAIGEGETELVLVYRRPFESESMDQETFQVNVVVE